MAKITSIIDIGSNSIRMVIFKKSSRFGFHILNESKAKVRLAQGSYNNNSNLTNEAIDRTFSSLLSFVKISKTYKSKKTICVATSALRDAPNKQVLISKAKRELKLNIKVINGEKEAYYGALACKNLLYTHSFLSLDVGGGSSELSVVLDKQIKQIASLNVGTIRLYELFFANNDYEGAREYLKNELNKYTFKNVPDTLIALGGSLRALGALIIKKTNYPLNSIHGFSYKYDDLKDFFKLILQSDEQGLLNIGVKEDRLTTIKQGVFILDFICDTFGLKNIITSGVGVREGVFLNDLLKNKHKSFPANYNCSVRSFSDRFSTNTKLSSYRAKIGGKIFDILSPLHKLDTKEDIHQDGKGDKNYHKKLLLNAIKLNDVGVSINFYASKEMSFDFVQTGLLYGMTHTQRIIIAYITKSTNKAFIDDKYFDKYKSILPELTKLKWLCLINNIANALCLDCSMQKYDFEFKYDETNAKGVLYIKSEYRTFMLDSALNALKLPKSLQIQF